MSEDEAVGVILGFECSPPPLRELPSLPISLPVLIPAKPETVTLESRGWFSKAKDVRGYEEIEVYVCVNCKTDKLIVGCGDYQTIIKCPNCGWEEMIHDG